MIRKYGKTNNESTREEPLIRKSTRVMSAFLAQRKHVDIT